MAEDQADLLQTMFVRVLGRVPSVSEKSVLDREFQRAHQYYQSDPDAAAQFVRVGQLVTVPEKRVTELAAGMVVASLILNLDEAITHE